VGGAPWAGDGRGALDRSGGRRRGRGGSGSPVGALRYGVVDFAGAPLTDDHPVYYFTQAPPVFFGRGPLQIATTLLLPASTAALVYALLAAGATRDDLGGYPAAPQPPTAVTASPGAAETSSR